MRHRTISRVNFATLVNLATLVNSATLNYSLPLALLVLGSLGLQPAAAQIIPDSTLPNNSVVPAGCTNCTITGGTRPTGGNNLFHSFSSFSVPTGGSANFDNGLDIQNIFTRVTGGNISNIDGTIRAQGSANLFLLNPNGIVFGPNARINIGGSFVGSTANSIRFSDFDFIATNPNDQASLLTVNVPLGLQFGNAPGQIAMRGTNATNTRITMAANQSFILAGNNLEIDNGRITSPGGHIELASLAGAGQVTFTDNAPFSPLQLNIPTDMPRGNITTANTSRFVTVSTRGGSMNFTAQRMDLLGDNFTQGGVLGIGADVPSGDINFDVRDALNMVNDAVVTNRVNTGAVGNAGNINVTAGSLSMTNGSQFTATLRGQGRAGNITINVRDTMRMAGYGEDGLSSLISSSVRSSATGNGGEVRITAREIVLDTGGAITGTTQGDGNGTSLTLNADTIRLLNGAQVYTSTEKTGQAGNITVNANQLIVSGSDPLFASRGRGPSGNSPYSGIYADVEPAATNAGGNIALNVGQLTVREGGQINASTSGGGNAGSLNIRATGNVEVSGVASFDQSPSRLRADVNAGSTGSGGSLVVTADQLNLTDGGQISTATAGAGNAGSIEITANRLNMSGVPTDVTVLPSRITATTSTAGQGGNIALNVGQLTVREGGQINASTSGGGNAGSLNIRATGSIEVSGVASFDQSPSQLRADVDAGSTGSGGSLVVTADQLNLTDGGQISTATAGTGNAGSIEITANRLNMSGVPTDATVLPSRITATTSTTGQGGNIRLQLGDAQVLDGTQITAATSGTGNGGNILFNATGTVELRGESANRDFASGLVTRVEAGAAGAGGNLEVQAQRLLLQDGAQVRAGTLGTGNSGRLTVQAGELLINGATGQNLTGLSTSTEGSSGQGGEMLINADRLSLLEGGQIRTGTSGSGDAGRLTIRSQDVSIVGSNTRGDRSRLFTESFGSGTGRGGNLILETQRLNLRDGGEVNTGAQTPGNAGNLTVTADRIAIVGSDRSNRPSGLFTTTVGSSGQGGDLTVTTNDLTLENGGRIRTGTESSGNAGNLTVRVSNQITASGETANGLFASGLFSDVGPGAAGQGGNLSVTSDRLTLRNGATVSAATNGSGNAGTLTVNADTILLTGESASRRNTTGFSTTTTNRGQGGNISVTGDRLTIAEGAVIRTGTLGSGNSGDLSVNVNRVDISSENILRSAPDPSGRPRQGGGISTAVLSPQATGRGGNVSIVSDRLDITNYGQISTSTLGAGNAGSVLIRSDVVNMQGVDSRRTSQRAGTTSISTFSGRGAGGSGGDITIISDRLFIRDSSSVIAGTAGIGNAGNVTIRSRETELEGSDYTRGIPAGLFSTAVTGSTGQGGNVTITGDRLRVLNGALIATGTFTSGNAGNIRVNVDDVEVSGSSPVSGISGLRSSVEVATATGQGGDIFIESDRLRLLDGGQVTSSTLGQGSAGNIAVNARSIELSGIAEDMPTLGDRAENTVRFVRNSNISAAAVSPTGNSANVSGSAGSVTVNAETLRVSNGAALTVSSLGSGNAGNLTIRANSVQLENGGLLQAEANAGNQGNIRITAPAISLSDRSRISTNAQGTATGGNISINTRYLIANGNSDITANSVSSFGGRVQVTADGILGAEFRPQLTPDNDITASSERGAEFSGTVTLQTPNVNPGQGATELPETVVDSSTQVAAACSGSTDNTFVATGRGGVPPTPEQALLGQNIWTDLRSIGVTSEASSQLEASPDQQSNQSEASPTLMEAQGWRMTPEGKVELVADATEVMTPTHCIAQ